MKKLILSCMMLLAASATMNAQGMFNHLTVGATAGTPGWGLDVATPICDYVHLRAGFAMMPKIKVNEDLDVNTEIDQGLIAYAISHGKTISQNPGKMAAQGKLNIVNGKVLVDLYPMKTSSFHFTAGAYFGTSDIVSVYNREEDQSMKTVAIANSLIPEYNKGVSDEYKMRQIGVELGDYLLTPDANGNINAEIRTASFKPYVGIGFGRAVPRHLIGFMFEMGVMYWGSPKVYSNGNQLTSDDLDGNGGDILKYISKVTVYPVINFRLCGKLF